MKLDWPKPNRTLGFFDVLGLLGLLGLLVARFVPVARLPFWGCALRQTTGWPCPSCGLTRVAERVAHGNLAGAWEANPLGTLGAALFALIALTSFLHLLFKLSIPDFPLTRHEDFLSLAAIVLRVSFHSAYL